MKRRNEVLVGLLTTIAVAVLVTGTLWLLRGGLQRGYPLYARFEWGAGLKQGQPVLFSGVNVGYVDRVNLLRNGGLVTTLRIYKDQSVPEGTVAMIAPNGLFGDMLIALRAVAPTERSLEPGDTIPSVAGSVEVTEVLSRMDSVGSALLRLARALETELVDRKGLTELRETAQSANSMFRTFEQVALDQSRELLQTQATLRRVASAVDSTQIDSVIRGLRDASSSVGRLTEDLRETNSRISGLLAKVDSGSGSAALLLNDPGLYDEVLRLVKRVDSLTADLMLNPRKYFKFSIF